MKKIVLFFLSIVPTSIPCYLPLVTYIKPYSFELASHQDLGKTHFIVGKQFYSDPSKQKGNVPTKSNLQKDKEQEKLFFSSTSNICEHLCNAIDGELEGINIAMYMFNSKELADQLIAAKKRNVNVTVVLDSLCLTDPYSKAQMLSNAGINIYVRKKKGKGIRKGIMHLKFLHRLGNKDAFGGSYNYTKAAEQVNDDFVMYIDDQLSVDALEKEFNKLLAESIPYKEVALPEDMK